MYYHLLCAARHPFPLFQNLPHISLTRAGCSSASDIFSIAFPKPWSQDRGLEKPCFHPKATPALASSHILTPTPLELLATTSAPLRRSCLGTRFSSFRQLPTRVLLSLLDPYLVRLHSHPFRECPQAAAAPWGRTLHAPDCISHSNHDRNDSSHALT